VLLPLLAEDRRLLDAAPKIKKALFAAYMSCYRLRPARTWPPGLAQEWPPFVEQLKRFTSYFRSVESFAGEPEPRHLSIFTRDERRSFAQAILAPPRSEAFSSRTRMSPRFR
jgi:hypothetical protein